MPAVIEKKFVEMDLIIPFDSSTYGLYESKKELLRCGKLKIKINSNENTGHHRPHIHATFDDVDVVCSIDNIIEIIEPKSCPLRIANLVQEVIAHPTNLMKARILWNEVQSNYKFQDQDINTKNLTISRRENKIFLYTK